MNENTEKLIRELADKFGTTTEHLWGVLIHQAKISGIVNLFVCVAWCAAFVWAYRSLQRKTEYEKTSRSSWDSSDSHLAWFIYWFACILAMLFIGTSLSEIVGSLFNPEYWALKQIMDTLKPE